MQSDATDPQLEAALLAASADMGLKLTPQQVERMLQLHLACEQRIGVIILGPSGSGKSTLWQVGVWRHTNKRCQPAARTCHPVLSDPIHLYVLVSTGPMCCVTGSIRSSCAGLRICSSDIAYLRHGSCMFALFMSDVH